MLDIIKQPTGVYMLIDYINFKGEGLSLTERYNGQGWGILQVLETMDIDYPPSSSINEFVSSASHVLKNRIRNSPKGRNEKKWFRGWKNRLDSYM